MTPAMQNPASARQPYPKPAAKPEKAPAAMKRTPMRRGTKPPVLPTGRVRGSDWREHGKGRNWPACWQPEAKFQAHVEGLAHFYGWRASHAHLPYFDTAGQPDLTMICVKEGRRRALWAELKVRDKQGNWKAPKGEQAAWIADMILAGLDVRVWLWPDDDDEIHRELAI